MEKYIEKIVTEEFTRTTQRLHEENLELRMRLAKADSTLVDIRNRIAIESAPGEWTAYIYEQAGKALKQMRQPLEKSND